MLQLAAEDAVERRLQVDRVRRLQCEIESLLSLLALARCCGRSQKLFRAEDGCTRFLRLNPGDDISFVQPVAGIEFKACDQPRDGRAELCFSPVGSRP